MNNQITVIDNQNQTMNVNCIAYLLNNQNNKKYLFYSKGEFVQDGLIKMYVAEESNIINEISVDEWSNLKLIMQNIIKGMSTNEITLLPVNTTIKLGGEKVIALNQINIDTLKNNYSNGINISSQEIVSNKDLLSQSFSTPAELVQEPQRVQTIEEVQQVQPVQNVIQEQVQTNVMDSNNSVDLESSVANLNMSIPSFEVPTFENGPVQESTVINNNQISNELDVPSIPNEFVLNNSMENENASNTTILSESTPATNAPVESEFKVSSAPNIFDLPVSDLTTNVGAVENRGNFIDDIGNNNANIFDPIVPTVQELKEEKIEEPTVVEDEISDDIIDAQIAIAESNYKLYTGLAENNKKLVEVLKRQKKSSKQEELEKTASDLFKSSGGLDEEKVLGLSLAA